MRIYEITLSKERICHTCGKPIRVGDSAIKSKGGSSSCSATEIYHVYHHKECWKPK